MKDINRKYNLMMNLSKFTFNKNILNKVVILNYNQFIAKLCPIYNIWLT